MAARCSSSREVTIGRGKACFWEGVAPRMAFHKKVRACPLPPLTAQLPVPAAPGAPRCSLPCLFTFRAPACRHSLPPSRRGRRAGGRPCRLDRAQTPFSDVTSRGGPEVSATSSPIHQEAGNMTVLGDTCRDKQGQLGVAKLRKREAGGLFP